MEDFACSTGATALIALWVADLILVLPALAFVFRRLQVTNAKLGFPQSRALVWSHLWRVELPSVIGRPGPIERVVWAMVAAALLLPVIALPVVFVSQAIYIDCPPPPIEEMPVD